MVLDTEDLVGKRRKENEALEEVELHAWFFKIKTQDFRLGKCTERNAAMVIMVGKALGIAIP